MSKNVNRLSTVIGRQGAADTRIWSWADPVYFTVVAGVKTAAIPSPECLAVEYDAT